MRITLRLDSLRWLLIAVLTAILVAGLFAEIAENVWRARDAEDLLEFFSLSEEWNLPTWFSSVLLFSCGAVLAAIAASKRRTGALYLRHWWVLAAGFFYISLDEAVQIHEHAGGWVDVGGILYFDWVIPASILVAILGVSYLGFLAHLPRVVQEFITAHFLKGLGSPGFGAPLRSFNNARHQVPVGVFGGTDSQQLAIAQIAQAAQIKKLGVLVNEDRGLSGVKPKGFGRIANAKFQDFDAIGLGGNEMTPFMHHDQEQQHGHKGPNGDQNAFNQPRFVARRSR